MSTRDDKQQNKLNFITLKIFQKDLDQDMFVNTFYFTHFSNTRY